MSYSGFYINLDRSTARRAEIESEIARVGLAERYQRFAAADGNTLNLPGPRISAPEVGCFLSHYLLLKQNSASLLPLHVLEDDAVLSHAMAKVLEATIDGGVLDQYDILFTETFMSPSGIEYHKAKLAFDKAVDRDPSGRITQIRPTLIRHFAGTSSYLVKPASIPHLVEVLECGLAQGPARPVDIVLRAAMRESVLKGACIFPFVTGIRLGAEKTIPGRNHDPTTELALSLGRASFFVDADIEALNAQAEMLIQLPTQDAHHRLLSRILAFVVTEQFQRF